MTWWNINVEIRSCLEFLIFIVRYFVTKLMYYTTREGLLLFFRSISLVVQSFLANKFNLVKTLHTLDLMGNIGRYDSFYNLHVSTFLKIAKFYWITPLLYWITPYQYLHQYFYVQYVLWGDSPRGWITVLRVPSRWID